MPPWILWMPIMIGKNVKSSKRICKIIMKSNVAFYAITNMKRAKQLSNRPSSMMRMCSHYHRKRRNSCGWNSMHHSNGIIYPESLLSIHYLYTRWLANSHCQNSGKHIYGVSSEISKPHLHSINQYHKAEHIYFVRVCVCVCMCV